MIIPQIAENLTRSGDLKIPDICPVCGKEARVIKENEVESLYCMNPDCVAKKIKAFTLFVSRDAMNIDGVVRGYAGEVYCQRFYSQLRRLFSRSENTVTRSFPWRDSGKNPLKTLWTVWRKREKRRLPK